jgi:hypothetical protein
MQLVWLAAEPAPSRWRAQSEDTGEFRAEIRERSLSRQEGYLTS